RSRRFRRSTACARWNTARSRWTYWVRRSTTRPSATPAGSSSPRVPSSTSEGFCRTACGPESVRRPSDCSGPPSVPALGTPCGHVHQGLAQFLHLVGTDPWDGVTEGLWHDRLGEPQTLRLGDPAANPRHRAHVAGQPDLTDRDE